MRLTLTLGIFPIKSPFKATLDLLDLGRASQESQDLEEYHQVIQALDDMTLAQWAGLGMIEICLKK